MNAKKKSSKGAQTIFWWIVWIGLTILAFFAAVAIWNPIIAEKFGSVRETKASVMWVVAVFGTWILFLVPLIIVMYQKVDKTYEDARLKKEKLAHQFRSIYVEPEKRKIPERLSKKLASCPETIEGGHLVSLILADGRTIPNVVIKECREIWGIYDATEISFEGKEVLDLEVNNFKNPPAFFASNWLRLDGVKPQV